MLQRRGRVTYGALKLQFHLDDNQLTILKDDLLYAHAQVVDDEGRGLIWTGAPSTEPAACLPPHGASWAGTTHVHAHLSGREAPDLS